MRCIVECPIQMDSQIGAERCVTIAVHFHIKIAGVHVSLKVLEVWVKLEKLLCALSRRKPIFGLDLLEASICFPCKIDL